MNAGKKPTSNESKIAAGTAKPSRVRYQMTVPEAMTIPLMPEYLTKEAQAIWSEQLERMIAGGATELDSDLIARYCSLEALTRLTFEIGECPPISALTELRRMGESLGMAGSQSRSTAITPVKPSNPFVKAMTGLK